MEKGDGAEITIHFYFILLPILEINGFVHCDLVAMVVRV